MTQKTEQWPVLWTPAYIGVGSNLDDPAVQLEKAVAALADVPRTRRISRSGVYRSVPLGPVDQPDFFNAVVGLLTELEPAALLQELKRLERVLGRAAPIVRWGPRVIDLDLLVYGRVQMQDAALTLPHPGLQDRNFVLLPLLDIAPELDVPGLGRVDRLAATVNPGGIERVPAASPASTFQPRLQR